MIFVFFELFFESLNEYLNSNYSFFRSIWLQVETIAKKNRDKKQVHLIILQV